MIEATARELATRIVTHLREDEGFDAPYVDDSDIRSVVVDGRVDLVGLAERILEWTREPSESLARERFVLAQQIAVNRNLVEDLITARADGWDEGWAALVEEHAIQRRDPSHPIGRNNPYRAIKL